MLVHPEITPPDNFYHFRDTTLLFRISLWYRNDFQRDAATVFLRADDRTAQVAGQGRTELRNATIISGQPLQAFGRLPAISGEELFPARLPVGGLKRVDQGAANAEARNQTHASEDTAGNAGYARGLWPQPHSRVRFRS